MIVQFDIIRMNNVLILNPLFSSRFQNNWKVEHRQKEGMKEKVWEGRSKQRNYQSNNKKQPII